MNAAAYHIDREEIDAAFVLLKRGLTAPASEEKARLVAAVLSSDMNMQDPAWLTSWTDEHARVVHFVPGPKFLELLMPVVTINVPQVRPQQRHWLARTVAGAVRRLFKETDQ